MNEITIFKNKEFGRVRVTVINNTPYFNGSDVATALGYTKPQNAISAHCKGALKQGIGVQTGIKADGTAAIQQIEMLFIPESDIYRLVMRSKLPEAEKFQDWVVEEVLPSIRKTGSYSVPQSAPMTDLELVSRAFLVVHKQVEERDKVIALQSEKIVKLEPKARFADAIGGADNCISVGEMAKLLCQNGYKTGQRRLFDMLFAEGYIMRNPQGRYIPQQNSMNLGLMRIEESLWVLNKEAVTIPTIRITPKGQQYFINRYACRQISAFGVTK